MITSCKEKNTWGEGTPPLAKKVEQVLEIHGDKRIDQYYWMNDRENPDVISYLEAENAYLEAKMEPVARLQEELYIEMKARIREDEQSAPVFSNGYYYYTRYETGGEYPVYCRRKSNMEADEEIILDVNEMAKPYSYYNVGQYDVSLNNKLLAFTYDTVGRRQYTIGIKNLETGKITETNIKNASGDIAWAADNETVFFTSIDPATLRYDRVMRYNFTSTEEPVMVYTENDESYYYMHVSRTKDELFIEIKINSTMSDETLLLPSGQPLGEFKAFQNRERDLLYSIFPAENKFYILTNKDAKNFRLMETPADATDISNWKEVVAHRDDVLLEQVEVFSSYLVLLERNKGLGQLRVFDLASGEGHYISFDEEAFTVRAGANYEMESGILRYNYTSPTTPMSSYDYNMKTREKTLVKQQEVVGDFSPENYETRRLYAGARDGSMVPVTIVYRKGIQKNGNNPLLLYAYGSYGYSLNPRFNHSVLSLLDRGFIYAMAHVRGGEDLGRQWYEDGKLFKKKNTFTDFIDIADFLIAEGYSSSDKMFASGGSAGGLLIGVIVNERPELFKGVLAAVPFVDVVTTMLDETIPLTTAEYDEWGNPNVKEYYDYMLSYSPYDKVSAHAYPNMLVTAGLHDSQVQYWEPAKWVAKLREYNTSDNIILLFTNMEAGHGGASGRFNRLRELAREYAFFIELAKGRK